MLANREGHLRRIARQRYARDVVEGRESSRRPLDIVEERTVLQMRVGVPDSVVEGKSLGKLDPVGARIR